MDIERPPVCLQCKLAEFEFGMITQILAAQVCTQFESESSKSRLTLSSEPSGQSSSPSHRHFAVTQYFSEHWNCLIGSHFVGKHLASSEPSPQSSSRSQTHRLWIQRPLLQVNSSERQVSSGWEEEWNRISERWGLSWRLCRRSVSLVCLVRSLVAKIPSQMFAIEYSKQILEELLRLASLNI